jgi:hypothetical protein
MTTENIIKLHRRNGITTSLNRDRIYLEILYTINKFSSHFL